MTKPPLDSKLEAKLQGAADQLNAVLKEVRKTHPHANYYVDASESIHLMSGPSHDGGGIARQDRILASLRVHSIDGGDW